MKYFEKVFHAVVLSTAVGFWGAQAHGQEAFNAELPMICGPTENLLQALRDNYSEEVVFMAAGVNSSGHELFHSLWQSQQGTWTFLVVNKENSTTCVIASGDNFQNFVPSGI